MVSGSRIDGGTQILPARVQTMIQNLKEIVQNHSDADIYSMLKETNMEPNETAQKLLNQDPFREVKRKSFKKTENAGHRGSAGPRKPVEHTVQETKSQAPMNLNSRRGGYTRNTLPGTRREFRVVNDKRVNQNPVREMKPVSVQCSTSANVPVTPNVSGKSSTGIRADQKAEGIRNSEGLKSSQASDGPSDAGSKHAKDAHSYRTQGKELFEDTRATVFNPNSRVQGSKPYDSRPHSASSATTSSVVGVYSSSSDPVHVPSPDSRSSGAVGAIKREVGVVGVRRHSSSNLPKHPSVPSSSFSTSLMGKEVSGSSGSIESPTTLTKSDQLSQATISESVMSSVPVSRSFLSNQYSGKAYQQLVGHHKAPQPNMEWKPKLSQKSSLISSPGVIGTPSTPISPPTDISTDLVKEADHLQEELSRANIFENQHVIIPQHLRVPESDRTRLTFGSFGAGFDSTNSFASGFQAIEIAEQANVEPSAGVSAPSSSSEDINQVDLLDDPTRNPGSASPASAEASEHPLPEKNESTSLGNMENYVDIGLVRNSSPSYTPAEPQQQQVPPEMSSFPVYDPQIGYHMPFFRPALDDSVQDQSLPSQHEALSSHVANSIPASTVAMMQQQPVAQMYPQVHLSHFPNYMPYRFSPVYVPPMAVPGYSSNPAYPHPPNGNNYLLVPGSSSHLAGGGLKYGTSQFKPIPAGNPAGFGNFANPAGYPINPQGTVGGVSGLEDSTRIKYKDGSLYVPNPQAETSEIWIQTPRELPGMQSAPYFNIPGQAPHGAYLQSHTGHASFNSGTAQSAHVQFPGLYHPTQQTSGIGNPHHMVPGMGGNVGVGVAAAAPGAQVGPYQQPQMGHLNWTTNF